MVPKPQKKSYAERMNSVNARSDKEVFDQILTFSDAQIDLYSDEYIKNCKEVEREFVNKTSLNRIDMGFLIIATMMQCVRWYLLTNDKYRMDAATNDAVIEKAAKGMKKLHIPALSEILLDHRVPYDAMHYTDFYKEMYTKVTDKGAEVISAGLSGTTHRYLTLGHDPIAGLVFGTINIATNTCTKSDFPVLTTYAVENMKLDFQLPFYEIFDYAKLSYDKDRKCLVGALAKQIIHSSTDVFTKQGLPLPMLNMISPEASKYLIKNHIDLYSTTRAVMLAELINYLVSKGHGFFKKDCENEKLYNVRTMKVVTYSNILSSMINGIYVYNTGDMNRFDLGGYCTTLYELVTNTQKINEIKYQFMRQLIEGKLQKEEDEVNERLANYGFDI